MNKEKCVHCAYLRNGVCAVKNMPLNFITDDCMAFYKVQGGKVVLLDNGKRMLIAGR